LLLLLLLLEPASGFLLLSERRLLVGVRRAEMVVVCALEVSRGRHHVPRVRLSGSVESRRVSVRDVHALVNG
jgi:hypothetical protein